MVVDERWFGREFVDELETNFGAEGHGERDGTIELDDGRGLALSERGIECGDALPVGLIAGTGARVAGGDGGLQRVGTGCAAQLLLRARVQPGRGR